MIYNLRTCLSPSSASMLKEWSNSKMVQFADSRGHVRELTRLITSTERVYRKPPIKLRVMIVMSSRKMLNVFAYEVDSCIVETQSLQRHRHIRCKQDTLIKRMTFASRCPIIYTPVFIYSNGCAAFASSVPSSVWSMKRMTFALSVPSHVYANLHLLERLCCLRLVGTQWCSIPLWGDVSVE
jgi:hypothetical protein